MDKTTTRLRKTFKYPVEDDSSDPETMDEEEQEKLITTLLQKNASQNAALTKIFLLLPLLSIVPYLPTLLAPRTVLLSLLSISSLLSTAFLVYVLPPGITGIPLLDARAAHSASGPLETFLPYMNGALCALLGVLGMVFRAREDVWWGFGWLPGVIYGVVLGGKVIMGSVDPEAELGRLRYNYKGA